MNARLNIVLPVELQLRLHTVKDTEAPTYSSRLPDKHVLELNVMKREGRALDKVLLRTFFYNQLVEAQKQYRGMIAQLM